MRVEMVCLQEHLTYDPKIFKQLEYIKQQTEHVGAESISVRLENTMLSEDMLKQMVIKADFVFFMGICRDDVWKRLQMTNLVSISKLENTDAIVRVMNGRESVYFVFLPDWSENWKEQCERIVFSPMKELVKHLCDTVQGDVCQMDEQNLEMQVVKLLSDKSLTISCAESCTGGLLSARLVNVSGASEVLNQSYVTYANEAKQELLGVSAQTLADYGAVSQQTAREMAQGVAAVARADVGVGITGIAGPLGGSKEKPVGLVYIAVCYNDKTVVTKNHFTGNRLQVRIAATEKALWMIREVLHPEKKYV